MSIREPLMFQPLLKVRVWGGKRLKARAPEAPDDPVGESWEIADHGEDTTRVKAGAHAGRSLHELFVSERRSLVGEAVDPAAPDVFPLLLKLIEARRDLSVQVHPDDAYAREKAGDLGKSEAWYVLEADPGGLIYHGLREGVTRDCFAEAIHAGTVADCLRSFHPRPGDVIDIPSGTIHALGAGVTIAEIQQNSDTTYRVFDWNRVGLDGTPRPLHIEDALAVGRFHAPGPRTAEPVDLPCDGCRRERFIDGEKFRFERLRRFDAPATLTTEGRHFLLLTVVTGSAEIATDAGVIKCRAWDTALVPADAESCRVTAGPETEVLLFTRPGTEPV